MLLVEESTIPSALVTKENLMSSLAKTQKTQNGPLPRKGQIGRNSRVDVCGENTRRASVNHERATTFLPPIVYATSRTRGNYKYSEYFLIQQHMLLGQGRCLELHGMNDNFKND